MVRPPAGDCFRDVFAPLPSVSSWPVNDRRVRRPRPGSFDYTSVCSAISKASSTSIPRYLTMACYRATAYDEFVRHADELNKARAAPKD